jgi:hypothetical protein
VWPWFNLAANQKKPYCTSLKNHSPVRLVSRQWDTVDWTCVLCERRIHNDRASRSTSSQQLKCPFYSSRSGFFWGGAKHHITQVCQPPLRPRFGSLRLLAFPKAKIAVEKKEIHECYSRTVHKLSQRRLTASWLAPRESYCSRTHSKVSSERLSSYIKATQPVIEIFKLARYFPDIPLIGMCTWFVSF